MAKSAARRLIDTLDASAETRAADALAHLWLAIDDLLIARGQPRLEDAEIQSLGDPLLAAARALRDVGVL